MRKVLIIMTTILSSIGSLFAAGSEYQPVDIYLSLREQVLNLKSDQLGEFGNSPVLCVLMETGYPEAVATLVAVSDGSASLYFSNGGGIIGSGEHPDGKNASMNFIGKSKDYLEYAEFTKKFPLPKKGNTRFYFVTSKGVKTIEVKEETLGNNRHKLSPLFHKGHDLIYAVQMIEKQKNAEPSN